MPNTYAVSASNSTQYQGFPGEITNYSFTVTRAGTTSTAEDVFYQVDNVINVHGDEFVGGTFPSGLVHFNAGASSATVIVQVVGGHVFGPDAIFKLSLPNQGGQALGISAGDSGGVGITQNNYTIVGGGGTINLQYQMYSIPDRADLLLNGATIGSTNGPVSNGGTLSFSGASIHAGDTLSVIITGTDPGTAWDYTLNYTPGLSKAAEAQAVILSGGPNPAKWTTATAANGTWTSQSPSFVVNDATGAWNLAGFTGFNSTYLAEDAKYYVGLTKSALLDVAEDYATSQISNRIAAVSPDAADLFDKANKAYSLYGVLHEFVDKSMSLIDRGATAVIDNSMTAEQFDTEANQIASDLQADLVGLLIGVPGVSQLIKGINYLTNHSDQNFIVQQGVNALGVNDTHQHSIFAGADNNTLIGGSVRDVLYGGDGIDSISGNLGDDWLMGGAGNDTLNGNDGADILIGGAGADTLTGSTGVDRYSGTPGDWDGDTITDFAIGEKVVVSGFGVGPTLRLGWGNFSAALLFLVDAPSGPDGVISLTGAIAGGSYTVTAAADPAGVSFALTAIAGGTAGIDTYNGDGFANIYLAGAGNDTVNGNDGNDALRGDAGDDTLNGGNGDDTLQGGANNDALNGGAGLDLASYDDIAGAVTVNLLIAGAQNTGSGGNDTLNSIEGVIGSTFSDVLIGDANANVFRGQGGNDTMYTGAGDDYVNGGLGLDGAILGDGNDTADLGDGNDYAYGGLGNDTLNGNAGTDILLGEDGADVINGGSEQDYLFGQAGDDVLDGGAGVDVVIGDIGNDALYGGDGNDYLYAGPGNDAAVGGDGADLFVMESGDDVVVGDEGNDFVYAGDGNDTIYGGAGSDILLGEAGNDIITPGTGVDYVFLGTGADTLVVDSSASDLGVTVLFNFTAGDGDGDVLRLLNSGWSSLAQVQAATVDTGNGYSILTIDADTAIWMIGVTPAQLTAGDVLFA